MFKKLILLFILVALVTSNVDARLRIKFKLPKFLRSNEIRLETREYFKHLRQEREYKKVLAEMFRIQNENSLHSEIDYHKNNQINYELKIKEHKLDYKVEEKKIDFFQDFEIQHTAKISNPKLLISLPKTELEYKIIYNKKDSITLSELDNINALNKYISKSYKKENYSYIQSKEDLLNYIRKVDSNTISIVAHSENGKIIIFPDGSKIEIDKLHIFCHKLKKSCQVISCYSQDLNIDYKITSKDAIDIWNKTFKKYQNNKIQRVGEFKKSLQDELVSKENNFIVISTLTIVVTTTGSVYTVRSVSYDIMQIIKLLEISYIDENYNKMISFSNKLLKLRFKQKERFKEFNLIIKSKNQENSRIKAYGNFRFSFFHSCNASNAIYMTHNIDGQYSTLEEDINLQIYLEILRHIRINIFLQKDYTYMEHINPIYLNYINQFEEKYPKLYLELEEDLNTTNKIIKDKKHYLNSRTERINYLIKKKSKDYRQLVELFLDLSKYQLEHNNYKEYVSFFKKALNYKPSISRLLIFFTHISKEDTPDKSIILNNKLFYQNLATLYSTFFQYSYQKLEISQENKDLFIKILLQKIKLDIIFDNKNIEKDINPIYTKFLQKNNLNNNLLYFNMIDNLAYKYFKEHNFEKSINTLNVLLNSNIFKYQKKDLLVKIYGKLSYYYLFSKKNKKAIYFAKKALILDKTQIWIYKNLAHSYLLNGNIKKAKKIYFKYRAQRMEAELLKKDKLWKEVVLDDFYQFKKNNINNIHLNKILQELFSNTKILDSNKSLDVIINMLNKIKNEKELNTVKTTFFNTIKNEKIENKKYINKFNALYDIYLMAIKEPKKYENRIHKAIDKLELRNIVDGKKATDERLIIFNIENHLLIIKTETDRFYNEDLEQKYQKYRDKKMGGIDFKAFQKKLDEEAIENELEYKIQQLEMEKEAADFKSVAFALVVALIALFAISIKS